MAAASEILLTKAEIQEIEEFARLNPVLKNQNVINLFGPGHKTIWNISPVKELVFVKGNEHTGFTHIHARHEFWSESFNWIDSNEASGNTRKKLQEPSRFRTDSIPILDYARIADAIYSEDNLDIENNHRPEEFELFVAHYKHKDGSTAKYKLLTYKGTKIVHTLYPKSDKNNRKKPKGFHFARGSVSGTRRIFKSIVEITVPYINHEGITKYSVLVRKFEKKNIEECLIQIHDENGKPDKFLVLGQRPLLKFDSLQIELMNWQHADLRGFENQIMEIEKRQH